MTIEEMLDSYDWEEAFGYADKATHVRDRKVVDGASMGDVAEIVASVDGENDGDEWCGLFRLNDGRWLVLRAGCDYTGWDCQAGGSAEVADSKADAIALGLTAEERRRLGL